MIARPSKGELRVHPHRFPEIFLRGKGVGGCVNSLEAISQATQVGVEASRLSVGFAAMACSS